MHVLSTKLLRFGTGYAQENTGTVYCDLYFRTPENRPNRPQRATLTKRLVVKPGSAGENPRDGILTLTPAANIEMLIRLNVIKQRIAVANGFEQHAPLRPSEY